LANGDVLASKGPAMSFARGLSAESAYIVRAPVKTILALQERSIDTKSTSVDVRSPTFTVGGVANDLVTILITPATKGFLTLQTEHGAKPSLK
jgi:hypothetical protein